MTLQFKRGILLFVKHAEKRKVIENLVNVPKTQKRHFWSREIGSLNILIESYPEDIFWKGLTFPKLFDSIIVLRSGYYANELKKKYKRYKYTIPSEKKLELGEKTGNDYKKKVKPKTLREFLS